MVEALFEKYPERKTDWPTQNMLGRLSRPEEYRGAAAFLISDASSFMTGSDLRMDGVSVLRKLCGVFANLFRVMLLGRSE
jgi:NAD(P)-dependent dehydrogenase (short-subunit alcohol dehydrogenase family)